MEIGDHGWNKHDNTHIGPASVEVRPAKENEINQLVSGGRKSSWKSEECLVMLDVVARLHGVLFSLENAPKIRDHWTG